MAAQPSLIPVEEYLRTTSDPDCEYVDGVIEERPVGEYDHATWQAILVAFFTVRQNELGILARPELRVRVAHRRFRVPDVTLLSRKAPREQIIIPGGSHTFIVLVLRRRVLLRWPGPSSQARWQLQNARSPPDHIRTVNGSGLGSQRHFGAGIGAFLDSAASNAMSSPLRCDAVLSHRRLPSILLDRCRPRSSFMAADCRSSVIATCRLATRSEIDSDVSTCQFAEALIVSL